MKCVRVATSGLVDAFDFASSNLASSRKRPEVSVTRQHQKPAQRDQSKQHVLPSIMARYSASVGQCMLAVHITSWPCPMYKSRISSAGPLTTRKHQTNTKSALTAKDVQAPFTLQLPHFHQSVQVTIARRVDREHGAKHGVCRRLAAAQD